MTRSGSPSPWPAWPPRCWRCSAPAPLLVKREATGYGQHVETSLLDGLLFLNAAPIFHREGHRPRVVRHTKSPILRVFETADGGAVMVNMSGTERWRELCRLLGVDDGGLDYSSPEGLSRLADREWNKAMLARFIEGFGSRTADEWETALASQPAGGGKVQHAGRVARSRPGARRRARGRGGGSGTGAGAVGRPGGADRGHVRRAASRAAGTGRSRARSAATASSTSPAFGPVPWRPACWPSSGPTSSRWSHLGARGRSS